MFRRIDDSISVAPQIAIEDVAEVKRQGFVHIVNNRPDGEQPGQPTAAEMRAAAEAAGIGYSAIPITHSGFTDLQVAEMAHALEKANGPVLAYCRSGTRSTYLWALARHAAGEDGAALTAKAAAAGYDVSALFR